MNGAFLFTDAARLVSMVPMKPSSVMVLWHLLARLDNRDWQRITQTQISRELGIDRGSVSRAMGELTERGIIREGSAQQFRLTPFLAWKGTLHDYRALSAARMQEAQDAAAWHETRAIMNLDAEGADWEKMAFDPASREASMAGMMQADRPADDGDDDDDDDDGGDDHMQFDREAMRPDYCGHDDWQAILYRFPRFGDEALQRVAYALRGRLADQDIHDWADDYQMKYYMDPPTVADAIRHGFIRPRPL